MKILENDATIGKRENGFYKIMSKYIRSIKMSFEQLQDCCRQRLLLSNLFGCAKNYYVDIKEETVYEFQGRCK